MVSLGSFRDRPLWPMLSGLIPARVWEFRPSVVFCACAFTLVCSLLLGGGTRGGFLSDAILELVAIPPLLIAIASLLDAPAWKSKTGSGTYWELAFCCAIALVPLVQLIPLPPSVWASLPGRGEIAKSLELLGGGLPWLPISVSPHSTWLSFLSLLPPMAVFIAAIQLDYRERRGLSLLIIAFGVISVFVGLTQVAQGESSPLRFFAVTNPTEAVGFFANRNHFAALLYVVFLFAAVWAIDIGFKIGSWTDVRTFETATIAALTAIFLVLLIMIAGEAMARSRAGLALTMVALLATFALGFMDRRRLSGAQTSKLLPIAIVVAVILIFQFALYRILNRFGTDPVEGARVIFAHVTVAAAKAFMPFGSGSGTFVPVYQMFEMPVDIIARTYANHAHDDFLELWLETGVVGPVLICVFLIWWGFATVKLWWKPPLHAHAFDCTLARAATVVVALLMVHSFVDYPMRTGAILAVFAVACAFIIEPLRSAEDDRRPALGLARDAARRMAAPKPAVAAATLMADPAVGPPPVRLTTEIAQASQRQSVGRWGEEIDWPEQWQNAASPKRSGAEAPQADPADNVKADAGTEPESK
jgi:O-antigen ligase